MSTSTVPRAASAGSPPSAAAPRPAHVVAVVDARTLGLRVAPQGTGHNAGPLGPFDDTILLRRQGQCRIGSNQ